MEAVEAVKGVDLDTEDFGVKKKNKYRVLFSEGLKAEPVTPALTLNGNTLLEPNELMTLIGAPGVGKSQLLEGLVYSFGCKKLGKAINESHSFGFMFSDEYAKGRLLHIDTERTNSDIHNSMKRLSKRFENVKEIDSFYTLNAQNVCSQKENSEILESELKEAKQSNKPYSVVFLDGILDFNTTNKDVMMDAEGGIQTIKFINKLADRYNCIFICTIHPNPESEKASGHIGSSLNKWSRAMLLLRRKQGFKDVFEITKKFKQGKQSHGKPIEDVYYVWNDTKGFNTAVSYADIEAKKSKVGKPKKIAPFEWYKTDASCISIVKKALGNETVNKTELVKLLSTAIKEDTESAVNYGREAVLVFIEYLESQSYLKPIKKHNKWLYEGEKIEDAIQSKQTSIL